MKLNIKDISVDALVKVIDESQMSQLIIKKMKQTQFDSVFEHAAANGALEVIDILYKALQDKVTTVQLGDYACVAYKKDRWDVIQDLSTFKCELAFQKVTDADLIFKKAIEKDDLLVVKALCAGNPDLDSFQVSDLLMAAQEKKASNSNAIMAVITDNYARGGLRFEINNLVKHAEKIQKTEEVKKNAKTNAPAHYGNKALEHANNLCNKLDALENSEEDNSREKQDFLKAIDDARDAMHGHRSTLGYVYNGILESIATLLTKVQSLFVSDNKSVKSSSAVNNGFFSLPTEREKRLHSIEDRFDKIFNASEKTDSSVSVKPETALKA